MTGIRTLLAAIALAILACAAPQAAMAQEEEVEISTFYDRLEPYGRWIEHPRYGYVWSPDVDTDWRPYTRGQWVFTDEYGWYWESEEQFGWATFHYGRWFLDDERGWLWIPGTEWGPAWVAWRHSDEQAGWAPLPPEAEWSGESLSFSASYYDSPRYASAWCFVPVAALTTYGIYRYIAPPHRNAYFLRSTTWVPRSFVPGRHGIYNVGIDRRRYEFITRRPLNPVQVVPSGRPHVGRPSSSGSVHIYKPRVHGSTAALPPPRITPPQDFRRRDSGSGPVFRQQPGQGGTHQQPGVYVPRQPDNRFGQPQPQPYPRQGQQPGVFAPGQPHPVQPQPHQGGHPQAQPRHVPPNGPPPQGQGGFQPRSNQVQQPQPGRAPPPPQQPRPQREPTPSATNQSN